MDGRGVVVGNERVLLRSETHAQDVLNSPSRR